MTIETLLTEAGLTDPDAVMFKTDSAAMLLMNGEFQVARMAGNPYSIKTKAQAELIVHCLKNFVPMMKALQWLRDEIGDAGAPKQPTVEAIAEIQDVLEKAEGPEVS